MRKQTNFEILFEAVTVVSPDQSERPEMTRPDKLYTSLLANPKLQISFRDFEVLLVVFGFEMRSGKGSHRNYKHPAIPALLTIQPRGKDALPYQVKRLLELVREYDLHIGS